MEFDSRSSLYGNAWFVLPSTLPAVVWLLTAALVPGLAVFGIVPFAGVALLSLPFLSRFAAQRAGKPRMRGIAVTVALCALFMVTNLATAGISFGQPLR